LWSAAGLSAVLAAVIALRAPNVSDEPAALRVAGAATEAIIALPTACTRARCQLAWRALPGHEFRLRVLSEDLEILQDVDLADASSFEVPSADLARVQSGDGLLWQVTAQDPAGRVVRSITYRQELE
jgi:hypothetical protein